MESNDALLSDWRKRALVLEREEPAAACASLSTPFGAALTEPALARPVPARADLRWLPALLALLLLLARHLLQLRHLRSPRRPAHLSASANPTSA